MPKVKKVVIIGTKDYSIIKSRKPVLGAFACINDCNEITVITAGKVASPISVQKGYRLITFDMVLPFSMVGFIAKIATKLAKAKIPIFVISAYSTDHILVKKAYVNKARGCLKSLGFEI